MRLTAPIHHLKRKARLLARQYSIPLHKALDQIAIEEGFQSWSHLTASVASANDPADRVLSQLLSGHLILIGARPGHGKTRLALQLALRARQIGRDGYFFTLDYHAGHVADQCAALGETSKHIRIDTSDDISAEYIIERLRSEKKKGLVVIDYLQLLDQDRSTPSLSQQMHLLRQFAKDTGVMFVVLSQIHRAFELSEKPVPDVTDVRLPNPLDLSVFDRCVFLHDGHLQIDQAA